MSRFWKRSKTRSGKDAVGHWRADSDEDDRSSKAPPKQFDRFEELTKKPRKAEPRESVEAAEQESEYPADETDEG